jgi:hypothetical protein
MIDAEEYRKRLEEIRRTSGWIDFRAKNLGLQFVRELAAEQERERKEREERD